MGIRELRDTLTATIRRVRAGESIEITHDGVPVALLAPLPASGLERLIAEGVLVRAEQPPRLPEPLLPAGPKTATEALQDDRGD